MKKIFISFLLLCLANVNCTYAADKSFHVMNYATVSVSAVSSVLHTKKYVGRIDPSKVAKHLMEVDRQGITGRPYVREVMKACLKAIPGGYDKRTADGTCKEFVNDVITEYNTIVRGKVKFNLIKYEPVGPRLLSDDGYFVATCSPQIPKIDKCVFNSNAKNVLGSKTERMVCGFASGSMVYNNFRTCVNGNDSFLWVWNDDQKQYAYKISLKPGLYHNYENKLSASDKKMVADKKINVYSVDIINDAIIISEPGITNKDKERNTNCVSLDGKKLLDIKNTMINGYIYDDIAEYNRAYRYLQSLAPQDRAVPECETVSMYSNYKKELESIDKVVPKLTAMNGTVVDVYVNYPKASADLKRVIAEHNYEYNTHALVETSEWGATEIAKAIIDNKISSGEHIVDNYLKLNCRVIATPREILECDNGAGFRMDFRFKEIR